MFSRWKSDYEFIRPTLKMRHPRAYLGHGLKKIKVHLRERSRSRLDTASKNPRASTPPPPTIQQDPSTILATVIHGTGEDSTLWSNAFKSLPVEAQKSISESQKASSKVELLQILLDVTEQKRKQCDDQKWKFTVKGRTINLADEADTIVRWLNRFKAFGDIAVNYDPNHAALPWAGESFLLEVRQKMDLSLRYDLLTYR